MTAPAFTRRTARILFPTRPFRKHYRRRLKAIPSHPQANCKPSTWEAVATLMRPSSHLQARGMAARSVRNWRDELQVSALAIEPAGVFSYSRNGVCASPSVRRAPSPISRPRSRPPQQSGSNPQSARQGLLAFEQGRVRIIEPTVERMRGEVAQVLLVQLAQCADQRTALAHDRGGKGVRLVFVAPRPPMHHRRKPERYHARQQPEQQ